MNQRHGKRVGDKRCSEVTAPSCDTLQKLAHAIGIFANIAAVAPGHRGDEFPALIPRRPQRAGERLGWLYI